jgi:hypothetical protein
MPNKQKKAFRTFDGPLTNQAAEELLKKKKQ